MPSAADLPADATPQPLARQGSLAAGPDSLPLDAPLPPVWQGHRPIDADLHATLQRLQRLHGPLERRALLLALLQTPGSARELQAWSEETVELTGAAHVKALVASLPDDARLPVFEQTLQRSAGAPAAERTELLKAARRLMCADGKVSALDRLRWLLMRHLLAGPTGLSVRPGPLADPLRAEQALADLPDTERHAIASVSAYLARLVPLQDDLAKVGAAGVAWHRAVLRSFWFDGAPACQVPDTDALAQGLVALQALSWMQRPVLARTWVHAALKVNQRLWRGEPLFLPAAEALRIATRLLDSPLHPALSERFIEEPPGPGAPAH